MNNTYFSKQATGLLFVLVFTLSGLLVGQSAATPIGAYASDGRLNLANFEIRQEQIGENYTYTYIEIKDGQHLVLRNDRLEFLNAVGEENYSFLMFDGARPTPPGAEDAISQEVKPLENAAMARVLGSKYMTVSTLAEVRYSALYPGVDLVVEGVNDGVLLSFVAKDPRDLAQVKLSSINAETEMVGAAALHTSPFGKLIIRPVTDGRLSGTPRGELTFTAAKRLGTITLHIAAQ